MILYPKGTFFVRKKHSFRTQKGRFFASKAAEPSAFCVLILANYK